jgi:hypothetical protein
MLARVTQPEDSEKRMERTILERNATEADVLKITANA